MFAHDVSLIVVETLPTRSAGKGDFSLAGAAGW